MKKQRVRNSLLMQISLLAIGIIIVMCIGLMYSKEHTKDIIFKNIVSSNDKLLLQVEGKMEEYYDNMKSIMTTVAYSPTVVKYFEQNENERIKASGEIALVFSNAVLLEQDIEGIYLYDMQMKQIAGMGEALESNIIGMYPKERIEFSNICYLNQVNVPYFLIYLPVYDLNNRQYGKQIGVCVFLMKTSRFQRMLEDSQITEYAEVYLADGNDRVLETIGGQELTSLSANMKKSDDVYYVTVQEVKMDGWKVVSRIQRDGIDVEAQSNVELINSAYMIAIALIIIMVAYCYWRILYRIRKIGKFINQSVNDSALRMEEVSRDELGIVADSLNQMLDERERMNQEILASQTKMYEVELDKRQMQILAYRNQINPHFLYNTFDCIRSMALFHDVDDIAEITMALSKVFRFAVKAENIVTVQDELNYIEEYAKIIDYRFMGKIKVNIFAKEEILKKEVIKLMLQPLVENAVFHGLEQKVDGGIVTVSVEQCGEKNLCFVIEDNGCGMEQVKVDVLWQTLDSNLERKGIGIANIYQRLKLFYEDDFTFEIKSDLDKGTRITIIVPDYVKETKRVHV